ncbi:Protein kintoun [Schistosoma japonicum]|nr:Protein kintoun [Schistosoma japonicum]
MNESRELKLTSDEVLKLKKAFKDPEFQKLFKEYAEEISDPANKKRYEDEIRLMELEQGMDVVFVNPIPGHCLKTRHWPDILHCSESKTIPKENSESARESVKIFINVCQSDKVECPEMKPVTNSITRQGESNIYWSLPHCFIPPREDIDKAKKHAMVYDVAFNPKAFELAKSSVSIKELLDVTAIDGVQKQYNLCFGKTFSQAQQLFSYRKKTHSECPRNGLPFTDPICDKHLLKTVRLLKGVQYKGVARPTVIRRRRSDYEQRQAELKKREAEDLKLCKSTEQEQAIKMLSSYPNYSNPECLDNSINKNDGSKTSTPVKPDYSITYSSDFDLSNCRDSNDVNPLRPPDRLIINIKLPGLSSSSCVDLEVTKTHIHLISQKPISYLLDLKLPYEVNDSEGTAKFDKSVHTLCITLPLAKIIEPAAYKPADCSISSNDGKDDLKSVACNSTSTNTSDHESVAVNGTTVGKRTRRKRRKRRPKSNGATENVGDITSSGSSLSECSEVDISEPIVAETSTDKSVAQTQNQYDKLLDINGTFSKIGQNIGEDKLMESQSLSTAIASISSNVEIKINQVSSCEMILSKDSCGSGGFTMDWGIVLQCPSSVATKMSELTLNDNIESFNCYHQSRESSVLSPQIISCRISPKNAVLVIRKPSCNCGDLSMNKKLFSELLANRAVWWTSVATGRTLTAGMQECSFIGMEAFASHSKRNSFISNFNETFDDLHYNDISCSTGLANKESSFSNDRSVSKLSMCNKLLQENCTMYRQHLKSVSVILLSDQCCSIEWDPNAESERNFGFNVIEPNDSDFTSNHVSNLINQHSNKMDTVNDNVDNCSVKRPRCNSTPGGNPSQTGLVLKSILKQRSISESSGDEMVILDGNILRDAGLAGNNECYLTLDDFPNSSSDATYDIVASNSDFRRCKSNDKLSGTCQNGALQSTQCRPHSTVCRPRIRSVSFCQQDQHVDFSPRDTVETLHNTKNLRKREAHRRRASGGYSRQPNSDKKMHSKMGCDIGTPMFDTCKSLGDASLKESDHCNGNSNYVVSERNSDNFTELSTVNILPDTFNPDETEPIITLHSPESGIANPSSTDVSNHQHLTNPVVATKCVENIVELAPKQLEAINNGSSINCDFSAVHLTASPILELDEE